MSFVIREIPQVRVIEFMGEKIQFIPVDGNYYVSQDHINRAIGYDIGHPKKYFRDIGKRRKSLPLVVFGCNVYNLDDCYDLKSAIFAIETSCVLDRSKALPFLALMAAIPFTKVQDSFTASFDKERLQLLLDRHPKWPDVLKLWNAGKTEREISNTLEMTITAVRSAVFNMKNHGLDLIPKRLRKQRLRHDGGE